MAVNDQDTKSRKLRVRWSYRLGPEMLVSPHELRFGLPTSNGTLAPALGVAEAHAGLRDKPYLLDGDWLYRVDVLGEENPEGRMAQVVPFEPRRVAHEPAVRFAPPVGGAA